jgi:hypothetical protein
MDTISWSKGSIFETEDSPPRPPMLKVMTRRLVVGFDGEELRGVSGETTQARLGFRTSAYFVFLQEGLSLGVGGMEVHGGKHIKHEGCWHVQVKEGGGVGDPLPGVEEIPGKHMKHVNSWH